MTNRLASETSPYLLQHAHNPVDWYPWGDDAFARAKREDKPVFLSIGYSACHWCHVMERESFENEQIAALLNRDFISVKVDREERPDIDSIYMQAVQMMTGHGGWPMSMFLTPEGVPFYGGTYFPPEDRHGMPGFPSVLEQLSRAFRERRDDITTASEEMRDVLNARVVATAGDSALPDRDAVVSLAQLLVRNFDPVHGGFGGAPKFPPSMMLEFMMQVAAATRSDQLLHAVDFTLQKMACGGLYDQVGGGFHRYSVDEKWLVPHFEKMLYDNALLTRVYVHVWQHSKQPLLQRVVRETIGFVEREMTSPAGGFYSTLDADSEGVEGKFYVWSRAEVMDALGEEEGAIFCALYDVSEQGNWEEQNILNLPQPFESVATMLGITADRLTEIAARGKCHLYGLREHRVRPARDEKILAGWNGWMLAAISEAAMALDDDGFRALARRNADFLAREMWDGQRLYRSYKDGVRKIGGLLEDYSGVAWGLLAAFEATQERRYLDLAQTLGNEILLRFSDEENGGFFDTPHDHEQLIARPKDLMDNATPSGNSVTIEVLLKLGLYFGEERYRTAADRALKATLALSSRYPSAFGYLLAAANYGALGWKEIVITGEGERRRDLLAVVGDLFLPRRILIASAQPDLPVMNERNDTETRAYVCEHYRCAAPTASPGELRAQLTG